MDEENTRLAVAAKTLAEGKASRVKLLSDTIMAATRLPEDTRRELSAAVADVISPDMADDQIGSSPRARGTQVGR